MASNSEPVIVFYKSVTCGHCINLTNMWDSVTAELKSVHPNLRFATVTASDNSGVFDENIAPKNLIKYGKWFPMILLVPGKLWDAAMANLGPKNTVEIKDGVQIINAEWVGDDLKYVQKYDIRKVTEFSRWLKDALQNEDFKRAQSSSNTSWLKPVAPQQPTSFEVPKKSTLSTPIQPLLSSVTRPSNTNTSYVTAGLNETQGNICSMRIISRPR